ncbi:hypothetical protein ACWIGI_21920 [Nocardia sp. NPDC055321]
MPAPPKRWKAAWREVPKISPISAQVRPSSRAWRTSERRTSSTTLSRLRAARRAAMTDGVG